LKNEPYLRKAIAYLKPEYFLDSRAEQLVFTEIAAYVDQYKNPPTKDALWISLSRNTNIFESDLEKTEDLLEEISTDKVVDPIDWLDKETERFCQEKALYNAVSESIQIMSGKVKNKDKGIIPQLLTDALAITFDPNVGHDYINDADARFEYYHRPSTKYPFKIHAMNLATGGGLEGKTLNVIMAGPKVGKSLIMCDWAASYITSGYKVLYITLEMAQEKIAQRIDANLLNTSIKELMTLKKSEFDHKIAQMRSQVKGGLAIKEYPTASASVYHFRSLITELRLKKQFVPQIIIIDYLNICASSRTKMGNGVNTYTYVKNVAEEIRGLAVETGCPIISATQLNREGYKNSDPEMDHTSESFGLPATLDELWVVTTNDQLRALNQLSFKKLASRSTDVSEYKRFVVGVDYAKMKLFDIGEGGQTLINDGYQQTVPSKSINVFNNIGNIDFETGEIT